MFSTELSIVIPVYNAEKTIVSLVNKLILVLSDFRDYRIILVNDASTDQSLKQIEKLAGENKKIIGIDLDGNYGQQSAIFCGLRYVKTEFAVIMDDDGEHNPDDIKNLYEEIIKGYDVVYALDSADTKKTVIRDMGSKLRDFTFNYITEKPKEIKVCSFRIMNRKTVESIIKADTEFVYISMEILKHTINIQNIRVPYGKRGSSGHGFMKLVALLMKINIYYSKCKMFSIFRKKGPAFRILSVTDSGKEEI